jgi:hypothetical protein
LLLLLLLLLLLFVVGCLATLQADTDMTTDKSLEKVDECVEEFEQLKEGT